MDESKRVVPYSKGQALADEFGIQFFETSAKSNLKVEEASILSTQKFLAIVPGMSWGTVEPVRIDHDQPYAGFDLHDDAQSKLYLHWTKLPHALYCSICSGATCKSILLCYIQCCMYGSFGIASVQHSVAHGSKHQDSNQGSLSKPQLLTCLHTLKNSEPSATIGLCVC